MLPDNPLRVGYVVKRYPRFSETFIVNEILAHEQAGWDLEIFALRPPADTHFQDCISRVRAPVTYLFGEGSKAETFWPALQQAADDWLNVDALFQHAGNEKAIEVYQAILLAGHARQRGVEHLHAHFATSAASVARLASHLAGIPFTFTAHAKDIFHENVAQQALRRKLDDAAAAVTVSDFNVEFLRRQFAESADRVCRIYNGLHLDRFPFASPADRPPLIVAVGRLVEKKGFGDLISACALLRGQFEDIRCEIIGHGDLEGELRGQVRQLGLEQQVELTGPLPQGEVIQRVQSAAVCAAPCVVGADGNRDGLPTVLLEAMALGTPCVSTDVTGIPEVLVNGQTGLMTPQADPPSLAAALARLLEERDLRVRLAVAARRLIEAEFDVQRNAARLRRVFAESSTGRAASTAALQETA